MRWSLAGLVVLALAAGGAFWLWQRTRPSPVIRGSPTREFRPVERPAPPVDRGEPWPTYGYDKARSHVAPESFDLRPPYRRLWMMKARYYVEFPPSVAYGKVFVAQLKGHIYAVDSRTGQVDWHKSFGPYCTFASPTLSRGVLYQTFLPAPCDYGPRDHPAFRPPSKRPTGTR